MVQGVIDKKRAKISRLIMARSGLNRAQLSFVERVGNSRYIIDVYIKNLRIQSGYGKSYDEAYDDLVNELKFEEHSVRKSNI